MLANYRLCRVMKAEPSADGCVRTVSMGYLPRKNLRQTVYHPVPLEIKEVAFQRIALIVPVEEQEHVKAGPAGVDVHVEGE